MSLASTRSSQPVRIRGVRGSDATTYRLMELGLIDGASVEVIGRAPLGGAIQVRVGDFDLSLRHEHAELIDVA